MGAGLRPIATFEPSLGLEGVGILPVQGMTVQQVDGNYDPCALWDSTAQKIASFAVGPHHHSYWRIQTQDLVHESCQIFHLITVFNCNLRGSWCIAGDVFVNHIRHLWMEDETVYGPDTSRKMRHERREGAILGQQNSH